VPVTHAGGKLNLTTPHYDVDIALKLVENGK